MTGYDFCQWFSGVLDMNPDGLSAAQLDKVREKMKAVKSPAQFAAEAATKPVKDQGSLVARC